VHFSEKFFHSQCLKKQTAHLRNRAAQLIIFQGSKHDKNRVSQINENGGMDSKGRKYMALRPDGKFGIVEANDDSRITLIF